MGLKPRACPFKAGSRRAPHVLGAGAAQPVRAARGARRLRVPAARLLAPRPLGSVGCRWVPLGGQVVAGGCRQRGGPGGPSPSLASCLASPPTGGSCAAGRCGGARRPPPSEARRGGGSSMAPTLLQKLFHKRGGGGGAAAPGGREGPAFR